MHIPDGFLTAPVWAGLAAVSLPAVVWTARKAQARVEESRAPLLGVMGAFVFAAQMINFPVGVGASGHLMGGALLAATLGPAPAVIVMTAILSIQALVFQDGGILALGANVFNMALAGVMAGYVPVLLMGGGRMRRVALFAGGFLSVFVSACLAIIELAASAVKIPPQALALSMAVFAITALVEGVITVAVLEAIERLNPRWVRNVGGHPRPLLGAVAAFAIVLAVCGVMLASTLPDGLEHLAQMAGFADRERSGFTTPLAGYETMFAANPWLRKASAGVVGLALTFAVCVLLGRWISRWRSA